MVKSFAGSLTIIIAIIGPIFSLFTTYYVYGQEEEISTGRTKSITLIASQKEIQVAPDNAFHPGGLTYNAMVFNGTIPGPVIVVDQGDQLEITLRNEGEVVHSLAIQAGFGPSAALGANASATGSTVQPGQSVTWTVKADSAGAFLYYSIGDGWSGVWEQVANGMYGGIVVHPVNERPAKEFYVVFSEMYMVGVGTNGTFDINKFVNNTPDLVLVNGMAYKYLPAIGGTSELPLNNNAQVFQVQPGELTRWYIFNGGPRGYVAFNLAGGILSVHDGSVQDRLGTQVLNDETWTIPPGSGSVIESVFPEEGVYVGMDHDLGRFFLGGAFAILATPESTPDDHPAGTFVPPRESPMVTGPVS